MYGILLIFFLLTSCAPSSPNQFRSRGATLAHELTEDLRQIQTRSELRAATPRLRRRFCELADLLIEAKKFRATHPDAQEGPPSIACDELFAELCRLYELPEGRELIESAQLDALKKIL